MAGFKNSAGTDLDSIFAPFVTGDKITFSTNYVDSGSFDLKDRYAPVAAGSAAAATGYKTPSGTDLGSIFAAAGTTSYVSVSDGGPASVVTGPTDASATYEVNSDGNIYHTTTEGGRTLAEDWRDWDTGTYEVRATVTSGTLTSGTTGTWIAVTTNPTWNLTNTGIGVSTAQFTLEFRALHMGVSMGVVDTATITLQAVVE
jgi:hypothetical protein